MLGDPLWKPIKMSRGSSPTPGIESAELALTMLSLHRPSARTTRSTLYGSDWSSSSSSDADTDSESIFVRGPNRRPARARGVRQGLQNLDHPPSPFGACRLGAPRPSQPPRPMADPAEAEPKIDEPQELVPRPDPEYVAEALRSAWHSIEALAREYVPPFMRWLSGAEHPDRLAPIVPITFLAALYLRPKWVRSTVRLAALLAKETARFYIVIVRDGPFGLFRQTVYHHVLSIR